MLDLGKSCLEGGVQHGSWVVGAQLKPGTQTRLLIIGCIVGELDAQMSPAGKADNQHRLIDARKLNGPYRAAQDRLKAVDQFPAPVWPREDMHIAAKGDHDVADPFLPISESSAEHCSPAVTSSHEARSRRPVMPRVARLSEVLRGAFPQHVFLHLARRGPRQCQGTSGLPCGRTADLLAGGQVMSVVAVS